MFEAIKIKQLKAKKDYAALIDMFSSRKPNVVEMAVEAMVDNGNDDRVIQALINEIKPERINFRKKNSPHGTWVVWPGALKALAAIDSPAVYRSLLENLATLDSCYLERQVLGILPKNDESVTTYMRRAAQHPDANQRIWLIGALQEWQGACRVELLVGLINDPDVNVAEKAIQALQSTKDPLAIPGLEAVCQTHPGLRKAALFTLKEMNWQGDPAAEAWYARYQADWAKCASFGADGIEPLMDALLSEPKETIPAVVAALAEHDPKNKGTETLDWLNRLLELYDQQHNQNKPSWERKGQNLSFLELSPALTELFNTLLKHSGPAMTDELLNVFERVKRVTKSELHGKPMIDFLCRHGDGKSAGALIDLYQRRLIGRDLLDDLVFAIIQVGGFDTEQANQFLLTAFERDDLYSIYFSKVKKIAEQADHWVVDRIASQVIDQINGGGYSKPRGENYISVLEDLYRSGRMGDDVKHRLLATAGELRQRHTDTIQRPMTDDDWVVGTHTDRGLVSRFLPTQ